MTGADPLETFRRARLTAEEALNAEALDRLARLPRLGEQPLTAIIPLLITDHLAHAWDIGHALRLDLRLDADLLEDSFAWARTNILRAPALFGPELGPASDANQQTRWLAYLGRASLRDDAGSRREAD